MSVLTAPRKRTRLDELGFVGRGKSRHRPRNDASLYGGDYPFFQTGDVKAANLYLTEYTQTYSEAGLAQSKMWEPGTLCITIAANIAETAILGIPGCFPDSVVGFIADPAKADVRFIKYYIDTIKLRMQNISHGATQDNLSLDKLLTFDFAVPDLPTQRRIAGILSAYDDLIENNLRRIRILEEMAQSLYREWFVHFRFPGHESVPLVDSPCGPIPEGWEVRRLGDLTALLSRGIAPKYDEDGPSIVINQKCIRDERLTLDKARRQSKPVAKEKLVRRGDVLVNSTGVGTLGRVAQVDFDSEDITVDTHVTILRPMPEIDSDYFGQVSFSLQPTFDRLGAGATGQTELSRAAISDVEVIVPPRELQDQYGSLVGSMRRSARVHLMQNQTLRHTRDLLLPKLISSESGNLS